jgi:integrase
MASSGNWAKTKFPGVRYRTNETRKYRGKPDRCYVIRYKRYDQSVSETVGWGSDGITGQLAANLRGELISNIKIAKGFQSLKERDETQATELKIKTLENLPFNQLAKEYIDWAKINKSSWKDDNSRYQIHLKPVIGNLPLQNISPLDLERLKRNIQKKGISPATVKQCLVLVRQIFNKGKAWEYFSGVSPFDKVTKGNRKFLEIPDNRRLRFLTHEEAENLLRELKVRSEQTHDMTLLSLDTGMRRSELFDLKIADINVQSGIINIKDGKNNKTRQAFMTKRVKQMLTCRLDRNSDGNFVFENKNGGRVNHISKVFDRTIEQLAFNKKVNDPRDKVSFHTLRHTFASWLAYQGTPLLTIKELGGWRSLGMVERYAHLIPDQKREAIAQLEQNRVSKTNDSKHISRIGIR